MTIETVVDATLIIYCCLMIPALFTECVWDCTKGTKYEDPWVRRMMERGKRWGNHWAHVTCFFLVLASLINP